MDKEEFAENLTKDLKNSIQISKNEESRLEREVFEKQNQLDSARATTSAFEESLSLVKALLL